MSFAVPQARRTLRLSPILHGARRWLCRYVRVVKCLRLRARMGAGDGIWADAAPSEHVPGLRFAQLP